MTPSGVTAVAARRFRRSLIDRPDDYPPGVEGSGTVNARRRVDLDGITVYSRKYRLGNISELNLPGLGRVGDARSSHVRSVNDFTPPPVTLNMSSS